MHNAYSSVSSSLTQKGETGKKGEGTKERIRSLVRKMASSSRDPSPLAPWNSSLTDAMIKAFEEKTQDLVKDLYEKLNASVTSLREISVLYRYIPITQDEGTTVTLVKRSFSSEKVYRLSFGEGNTFFLFPRVDGNAMEARYDGNRCLNMGEFYAFTYESYFGIKRVREGTGDYQEDAISITLPPRPSHISEEVYCKYVYRMRDGIVVHESYAFDPDLYNERQSVFTYAGVPWLKKTLVGTGCCNIIFRNLYNGEERRYLLNTSDPIVFYLDNEFYYLEDADTSSAEMMVKKTHVKQCRSNKIITTLSMVVADAVSLQGYVVLADANGTKFTVLSV